MKSIPAARIYAGTTKKDTWEKKVWENVYLHSEVHRNIDNDQEL